MQKLMPELLRLEPLCAQIIANSRAKRQTQKQQEKQQQKQQQQASGSEHATDPVEPLEATFPGNKKARLDSVPRSADPVAVAAVEPGKTPLVDSRHELHRMDSRTGSSGAPAAGQPPAALASARAQQASKQQALERHAEEGQEPHRAADAQLNSHKQLDKLTSLNSTSSPLLSRHSPDAVAPLSQKRPLQKRDNMASAQRKPSVPTWQDPPAKKPPVVAVAAHSGQEDMQHQHAAEQTSSRLSDHSSPTALQSASGLNHRRCAYLTSAWLQVT